MGSVQLFQRLKFGFGQAQADGAGLADYGWHGSVVPRWFSTPDKGRLLVRLGSRGAAHSRSISTATERCNKVTETTRRKRFFHSTTTPSTSVKGPSLIRTFLPVARWGYSSKGFPEFTMVSMERISDSGTGSNWLPKPTIPVTPGVSRTGTRYRGSNLQKTYPGKRGTSSSLVRSDQRRRVRTSGRNSSNPLARSREAAVRSNLERTLTAYHLISGVSW